MSIINVNDLSFGYSEKAILKDLTFQVGQGVFLAVAGPNGAGKTTLLNLLCGLLKPRDGRIKIEEKAIDSYSRKRLSQKIAVVRQEFVPVFDFTAEEVVSMARAPYLGVLGFEGPADRRIVADALEMTETSRFANRLLGSLSGGERQRIFIARALAQDTDILMLDEPTCFLDLKHQVGIYDLLKKMQKEKGKTVIAVTHDINLACQYCDEALLIGGSGDYMHGTAEEIFTAENIKMTFDVGGYCPKVERGKFFLPLGNLAKDYVLTEENLPKQD